MIVESSQVYMQARPPGHQPSYTYIQHADPVTQPWNMYAHYPRHDKKDVIMSPTGITTDTSYISNYDNHGQQHQMAAHDNAYPVTSSLLQERRATPGNIRTSHLNKDLSLK